MMNKRWHSMAALMLLSLGAVAGRETMAEPLRNPVARCADSGVLKHRGEYYISGVVLPRQMLVSPDLVHWRGPYQVITPRGQWWSAEDDRRLGIVDVHAPCMACVDGQIHLYWNGIGHAVAQEALGPYTEPVLDRRFDGEIDPFLFADEDGKCYFYTVKFDRGNVIFGQTMEGPHALSGQPVELLRATPGSWEERDGNIVEGPEVLRYRDRYYLLYAANNTSVRMGNYAIGCVTSDSPLGFREAGKYRHPVLEQSGFDETDASDVLLRMGSRGGAPWQYTVTRPAPGWAAPGFEPGDTWAAGRGGFGWPIREHSQVNHVGTPWQEPEIWLRTAFDLEHTPSEHLKIMIRHTEGVEVFFNGVAAYQAARRGGPRFVAPSQEAIAALHPGANVVAVHVTAPAAGDRYFDLGLIDPRDHEPDDWVWNTGQPNVVRGPNGFEWFLTYFAMWNEGPHMQGINRVFFFDRELFVDGPSGARPVQYQPAPYRATFADRFDTHRMDHLGTRHDQDWRYDGGLWHVEEEEARVSQGWDFGVPPAGTARAFPRTRPAENYLFEAWVRSLPGNQAPYGIVAWRQDEGHWLHITLVPEKGAWEWRLRFPTGVTVGGGSLPEGFEHTAYHKLRITKNAGNFHLWIDHLLATADGPIQAGPAGAGLPGLLSEGALAAFDAVVYTIGWDEYDGQITGWQGSSQPSGPPQTGGKTGIVLDGREEAQFRSKGDQLAACEFDLQLTALDTPVPDAASMGIHAVYVDEDNFLRVSMDPASQTLTAEGWRGGAPVGPWTAPLAHRTRLCPHRQTPAGGTDAVVTASHCFENDTVHAANDGLVPMKSQSSLPKHTFWRHKGTEEWIQYDFAAARRIDGAEVIWYDDQPRGGCATPASWRLLCRAGDRWVPVELTEGSYGAEKDVLNAVSFRAVETDAVRMVVQQREDFGSGIYEWTVHEAGQPGRLETVDLHLKRPGLVSSLELRLDPYGPYTLPASIVVRCAKADGFAPVAAATTRTEEDGALQWVTFSPVETDCLQVVMEQEPGTHARLVEAHAQVEGQHSYHLRTVKLADRVLVMLDGKQELEIPGAWPPSRVGLVADGMRASFNGIRCFAIE